MAQAPPILIYQPGGGVSSPIGSNPPVYSQAGTTALVEDHQYVDVVFGSIQTMEDWVLVGCIVVNEIDVDPLNIWPGIITDKTEAGFRIYFNGLPDSGNYYLHWSVSGINIEPSVATTYYLTGPATGASGEAATFTVALPPSTYVNATVTVTPSEGGLEIGVFSPETVTLTTNSPSQTFTFTPALYGETTITVNNDRGLTDPADLDFMVLADTYELSGPSAGDTGVASTDFTVSLPVGGAVVGTVTVTPSDGGGGGTFTPTTVALTTVAPSDTFTYTPASSGAKTISVTNDGDLTDPADIVYTASAPFSPLDIAGCKLWLKADSLALTDGATVSAWNDSSGLGNNFAADVNPPIYKTNIVNSKPVVRFDGGTQGFSSTTASIIPTNATNYTIFIVLMHPSLTNGMPFATGSVAGGGYSVSLQHFTDGVYHTHYDAGAVQASEASGLTAGTWDIITADWNGTNIHLWRNGTLKGTTGTTLMGRAGTDTSIGFDRPDGNVLRWPGDIAEIVVYNSALSAGDRNDVEDYLRTKYATP